YLEDRSLRRSCRAVSPPGGDLTLTGLQPAFGTGGDQLDDAHVHLDRHAVDGRLALAGVAVDKSRVRSCLDQSSLHCRGVDDLRFAGDDGECGLNTIAAPVGDPDR